MGLLHHQNCQISETKQNNVHYQYVGVIKKVIHTAVLLSSHVHLYKDENLNILYFTLVYCKIISIH